MLGTMKTARRFAPDPNVRTSETHPIHVDWLPLRGRSLARVGMTLAPGKRCASISGIRWERNLRADFGELRRLGVHQLVTLMQDKDFTKIHVSPSAFVGMAIQHGIVVDVFPVPDGTVMKPAEVREARKLIARVRHDKLPVAIHCVGGLGRTGFLAGILLREDGFTIAQTFGILRELRGEHCPETPDQREALLHYRPRSGP